MRPFTRRRLLQSAAAMYVANATASSLWADPLGIAPGLNLYTVGNSLATDLDGTLKQVKAIGYRYVEAYAYPGHPTFKDIRAAIDRAGLLCPSVHLNFNAANLDLLLDDANTLGVRYAVSSTLRPENFPQPNQPVRNLFETLTLDDFKRVAERMNRIAVRAQAAGLQYAYNNHNSEFRDQGEGQIGYDILLKQTDPKLVHFELECGWMALAGFDPREYLRNYPNRFRMLHLKDFVPGTGKSTSTAPGQHPEQTELGRGRMDYGPIFAAAAQCGIEYCFVEQEPPFPEGVSPFQAAEMDFQYLQGLKGL